jgi:hypothetical protein
MASLTGTKIKDTYDGLIKTIDNGGLGATAKQITDGVGNNSPIYVSTSGVGVGGSPTNAFDVIGESTVGNGTYGVKFSYSAGNTSGVIDTANSANTLEFRISGTERMRINASGFPLEVDGGSGDGVKIKAGNSSNDDSFLIANSGDTTLFVVDGAGNVLIGTTGIPNGTSVYGSGFTPQSNERDQLRMASNTTSGLDLVQFYNPNGKVGSILTNGSATSYVTSSDYRLKEDWQPMSGALDRVDALKPVNFAWKADGSRVDGFLAHELQEVIPEAVTGEKDAMRTEEYEVSPAVYEEVVHPAIAEELDADGNVIVEAQEEWTEQVLVSEAVMGTREVPDYQGIDQSKIVPLLVAAIQELKAEIEALKA